MLNNFVYYQLLSAYTFRLRLSLTLNEQLHFLLPRDSASVFRKLFTYHYVASV
jgi:hypothetical protein